MGTKVHYLPGYYSMRDLNEDSSSSSWPICYNGFIPRTIVDGYPGKDALKQKMLEHEAVFRNQVYELHRVYRIQRDMMEEAKRKELYRLRVSMEPSSSSSLRGSQVPSHDAHKWHMAGFPLINSGYERTCISGVEIENSPMSCTKGYNTFQNGSSLKESEPLDSRPLKVRKKLFDLQLPADEYIDTEEGERLSESKISDISSNGNPKAGRESTNLPLGDHVGMKADCRNIRLADLNEPIEIEEAMAPSTVGFLDHNGMTKGGNQPPKSNEETLRIRDGFSIQSTVGSNVNERGRLSHLYEAGSSKSNLGSVTHCLQKEKMPIPSHPVPDILFSSSCFSSLWGHPVSSWTKPTSSFTQKLITMGLHLDSPRDLPTSVNYLNCSRADNEVSEPSTNHGFGYFPKSSCFENSKPVINIDLNEAGDGRSKTTLPWLKCCKPAHTNEPAITDLNQPSSDCEIVLKKETAETRNVKKILGFPIFETVPSENAPSTSTSIGCPKEKKNRIIIDINLECQPDEEITVEKEKKETKGGTFIRDYIDLNSCVSDIEEDDALAPSYESKAAASVEIALEIDLEAPVENGDENEENETLQDEVLRSAAEIMASISFSCPKTNSDASLSESLIWFANQLVTNESMVTDGPDGPPPPHREMDDFEAMTLQIQETKEEDYISVPEFQNSEETGPADNNALAARSRRGQSRRGRQRRDFQRDILPGLVSLSRHEVTEDIQTFGGLMRATGHQWVSGLTRRNGGGRGRRRAVIESVPAISGPNNRACTPLVGQINKNIEGGLEDRSLTGWGKTTRRPRRQRCPTGNNNNNNNPQAVVLT